MTLLKRFLLFLSGFLILNFGTALIIAADIGVSPWDTVFIGFHQVTGLSIGASVFVIQMILVLVIALIERAKPEWLAFIAIGTSSVTLDFWLETLFNGFVPNSMIFAVFLAVIGVMFQALGIVVYLKAHFPKSQLDAIMLTVCKKCQWSIRRSRTVCESTAFLIGVLMGGPFGIGTFIAIFLLGPVLSFFHKLALRIEGIKSSKQKKAKVVVGQG